MGSNPRQVQPPGGVVCTFTLSFLNTQSTQHKFFNVDLKLSGRLVACFP